MIAASVLLHVLCATGLRGEAGLVAAPSKPADVDLDDVASRRPMRRADRAAASGSTDLAGFDGKQGSVPVDGSYQAGIKTPSRREPRCRWSDGLVLARRYRVDNEHLAIPLWLLLVAGPRPYAGPEAVVAPVVADESPTRTEPVEAPEPRAPKKATAVAAPRPPSAAPRTWVVGAFIDAGYVYDSNLPDNHVNRGIATAPRTGEFTVPLAAGYLRHDASEAEPWSLELALQFGPAATALVAVEPEPGGDASQFAGIEVWQHIGRANVGGRIPKAGTEIAAGVFGTPIGYWSFWPKDNWLYSTPWHLNAVPYVLMGGRILQPIGKHVQLQAWIVNGYQTYADVNKAPSYMLGGIITPISSLQIGHFDYFGPEDADISPSAWRWLSDTWLFYEAGRFGFSAVFDVMRERLTLVEDAPVALHLVGSVSPRFRVVDARDGKVQWYLAARGEAFWDRDGRMFGVEQLLGSASVNSDVRLWNHLTVRLEYRYDRSTNPAGFFYRREAIENDDDGLGRDQHTVFAMLSGTFEFWFATRRGKSGP